MPSLWRTDDVAANGWTLWNQGAMVGNGSNTAAQNVRGTISRSAGKLYVEFFANASAANEYHGLANEASVSTGPLGRTGKSVSIRYGVNLGTPDFTLNYTVLDALVYGGGHIIGMAVDFDTGGLWIANESNWCGGSDPATGLLPIASFNPATIGALFPAVELQQANEQWTLRTLASNQKYAAPAGFEAWDPPEALPAPLTGLNPYDSFNVILSDDGLSVSQVGWDSAQNARSVRSHSSGRVHVEFYNVVGIASWYGSTFGFSNGAFDLTIKLGFDTNSNSLGCVNHAGGQFLWYIDSGPATGNTYWRINDGDDFAIEIDFDNTLLWVKDITTGSGWNPFLNGAGFNFSPYLTSKPGPNMAPGPYFIDVGFWGFPSSGVAGSMTVNFGATPFKDIPTLGFSAWDPLEIRGDIAPGVTFGASISHSFTVDGDMGPIVNLSGRLNSIFPVAGDLPAWVDYAGTSVSFAVDYRANLAPQIAISGAQLSTSFDVLGDFAPEIDFAGNVTFFLPVSGSLASQIALGASLTANLVLQGSLPTQVTFAASGLVVGPLWADTAPPAPVAWKPSELCNG